MAANASFPTISSRIQSIRGLFPALKNKADDFVFSALCIKYSIYKNPSLSLSETELMDSIVDGSKDGGADFILLDPDNTEASDMIIAQAKYWEKITAEEAKNAVNKLVDFFLMLRASDFPKVRAEVASRFQRTYAETGEESKFIFALYVSSPQNSIRIQSLKKIINERLGDDDRYELRVFFGADIEEEIREAESRRPYVEKGSLKIDEKDNVLYYGENSVIVNISAKSLKTLYATHLNNLLSMNLRYFTKKQDIDSEIKSTINENPESFWYKNNGITVICESFSVDGRELKLENFSIINGGQTTYLVFKNGPGEEDEDFYIVCKVITAEGATQEDKDQFILDIAKATNSQKAIKDSDLKANSVEQVRFSRAMREKGVYYKTKRGEEVPKNYKAFSYFYADYPTTGKLYLAGIFQLPGKSRNKPSSMKDVKYYNPVYFSKTQSSCGIICDLLYVDYFYRNTFIPAFDKKYEGNPIITFANNARTICIAFVGLAARIIQGNIDSNDFINRINSVVSDSYYEDNIYPIIKRFDEMTYFIKPSKMIDKTSVDMRLEKLFTALIKEGYKTFKTTQRSDPSLVESNYLKKDSSYYQILSASWLDLSDAINECDEIFK